MKGEIYYNFQYTPQGIVLSHFGVGVSRTLWNVSPFSDWIMGISPLNFRPRANTFVPFSALENWRRNATHSHSCVQNSDQAAQTIPFIALAYNILLSLTWRSTTPRHIYTSKKTNWMSQRQDVPECVLVWTSWTYVCTVLLSLVFL